MSGPIGHKSAETETGPWFIGKTVGEMFEIRAVLGRGGMGIVYLAYDTATQKNVAIKVPLGKFVDDPGARRRFTKEAEAWTSLVHPHIVHAFDVKDDQSTDYRPAIFMDYCAGGSLAARLQRGPGLTLAEALDLGIQICWAMEFAHQKGHLHRDLKPGNVLLGVGGRALVTDFGLVKILAQDKAEALAGPEAGVRAGVLASLPQVGGTPEYMPPEQWLGRAEKPSDIYAFGVVLFELCCGVRPFAGADWATLRRLHEEGAIPDPRRLNGEIPEELAAIIQASMAKRPAERPQDFGVVACCLAQAYRRHTQHEHRPHRPKPPARELSRADREAQAWALIRLGIGCRLRGDLQDALRHYQKAGKLCQELGNKDGLHASLCNQAVILRDRGDLNEAMTRHKQAEQICRELGNKHGLQASLGNQAVILRDQGDLNGAMALLKQQEHLCRVSGDKDGLSISLGNQADILCIHGDLDGAMALHKQEEQICRELGNKRGLQRTLGNQAVILQTRRDLDMAMVLYRQQEQICRELSNKEDWAASLANQALLLGQGMNLWDAALPLAEEAFRIAGRASLDARDRWTGKILNEVRAHLRSNHPGTMKNEKKTTEKKEPSIDEIGEGFLRWYQDEKRREYTKRIEDLANRKPRDG